MIKIALGTTSDFKINAIKEIVEESGIEIDLAPVDVDSSVSEQPLRLVETRNGSINRAMEALKKREDAEAGLGIEVGYEPIDGMFFMHAWASIVDQDGKVYSEQSSTLELPKRFQELIKENKMIGDYVQDYAKKYDSKEWKYFTETFRFREPFLKESARNVLLRYCLRDEY